MGDINARLIALCRAKLKPADLAEFLLDDIANETFTKNLNTALEMKIEEKNKAAASQVPDSAKLDNLPDADG